MFNQTQPQPWKKYQAAKEGASRLQSPVHMHALCFGLEAKAAPGARIQGLGRVATTLPIGRQIALENGGPQPLNVHKAPPRRRTTSSPRTCRLPGRLRRGTVRGAQRRRRRVRRPPPAARARAPCLCARRAAHDARREAAPSGTFATCRSWRRSCPWPCQSRLIRVAFWCTLSTPTRQSGLGRL